MESSPPKARCVYCHSEVAVLDSYAHGDHIKCGTCGTRHKVQRGEHLRLVIADVAPLQEALRANEQLVQRLEEELRAARGRFGPGSNGILAGVAYLLWQVALRQRFLGASVALEALGVAVAAAVLLEVLNYFFLSKHQTMARLSSEIAEARSEGRHLQQKIREARKG